MEVQQDFKDLLALFNAHKVDYIIAGAHALAFHGAPRCSESPVFYEYANLTSYPPPGDG